VDYLGIISANLRNLTGIRSLAHELIQNADDAEGASWILFDIRDEALEVSNDGVFSDCGSRGAPECPFELVGPSPCDFHSFRRVAGGAKRLREETTGAFGIGFTAVYQVTDKPELVSEGTHWLVDDSQLENNRIVECPGCESCFDYKGTKFILPWAFEPGSPMRRALRAAHLDPTDIPAFVTTLREDAPLSILFLRHLSSVRVAANGEEAIRVTRERDRDSILISDGSSADMFYVLEGDFSDEETTLRSRFGSLIEPRRVSKVIVAVPESADPGTLFAFLPTETATGLTCHINADFYPTSDRKRLIFETDYQSDWNRAALDASARSLATGLVEIRDRIGAERVWQVLQRAFAKYQDATDAGELHWKSFWNELRGPAQSAPLTKTTAGDWRALEDLVLLEQQSTEDIVPILEALGIDVVASELRPLVFRTRREEGVQVEYLRARHLAHGMRSAGMTRRIDIGELPGPLRAREMRGQLLQELDRLLARSSRAERDKELESLGGCALALGTDGAIWPPNHVYIAGGETQRLLSQVVPDLVFLDDAAFPDDAASIRELCPHLSASQAVRLLTEIRPEALETLGSRTPESLQSLIPWFDARSHELDDDSRRALASLPLFPSEGSLRPLIELSLPGAFDDPLRLAGIIDTERVAGHVDFIRSLGARELSLHEYATLHVPKAVRGGIDAALRRELVTLLAQQFGRLSDNEEARIALRDLPLIECADGEFRAATSCYFDSAVVRDALGPEAAIARPEGNAQHDLYAWLGVQSQPRLEHLASRVQQLTVTPPSTGSVLAIAAIFGHLSDRTDDLKTSQAVLDILSQSEWLPAKPSVDRWHAPETIFAAFNPYLFESQAEFLSIRLQTQQQATGLMDLLGIRRAPTTDLVVAHILHQASAQLSVNPAVYLWLNNNAEDPALERLRGKPCLQIESGVYIRPDQAYWRPHPFGRMRYVLTGELQQYRKALNRIGVRDEPAPADAVEVLRELSQELGPTNIPASEEERSIVSGAWAMVQRGLESGLLANVQRLQSVKSICDTNALLTQPGHLLFRNDQWLANRFGQFLGPNLIDAEAGSWRAMKQAGVRPLSGAVHRTLSRKAVVGEAIDIAALVSARASQFARVAESAGAEADAVVVMARARSLSIMFCSAMEVTLELSALGQQPVVKEPVPAFFDIDNNTLFLIKDVSHHWMAGARELARALCPGEDSGRYALGFKEVLSAADLEAAAAALDEAGIAALVAADLLTPPAASTQVLGTADEEADDLPSVEPEVGQDRRVAPDDGDVPEGHEGRNGADQEEKTETTFESDKGETDRAQVLPASRPDRRRLKKPVAVMTVIPSAEKDPADTDPEVQRLRQEVDKAGIARVLAFELTAGRFPREMPHNNPGYDVESLDSESNVTRYIEVKSLGTFWDGNVTMSDFQYKAAQRLRELFWLYVVPDALVSDDVQPIRIQDPYGHATRYRFDRGWAAFGEKSIEPPASSLSREELPEEVRELIDETVRGGIPAPILGYMVIGSNEEGEWLASAAWPDRRVIICSEPDERRDEYLSLQEWTIVLPNEWSSAELTQLLLGQI
jgi:hypothetical protein